MQTELDAGQRRRLADSIAAGGAFTFASDDLSLYGDEEWALLESVRTVARRAASTCPTRSRCTAAS